MTVRLSLAAVLPLPRARARRGGHLRTLAVTARVPERPAPVAPAVLSSLRAARARRAAASQDRAFYTCACGFAWTGAVTTTVDCPHCGTGQAW